MKKRVGYEIKYMWGKIFQILLKHRLLYLVLQGRKHNFSIVQLNLEFDLEHLIQNFDVENLRWCRKQQLCTATPFLLYRQNSKNGF